MGYGDIQGSADELMGEMIKGLGGGSGALGSSTFNSLASIIAQQIGGVILDRSSYEFLYFILFMGAILGLFICFFSHLPSGDEHQLFN